MNRQLANGSRLWVDLTHPFFFSLSRRIGQVPSWSIVRACLPRELFNKNPELIGKGALPRAKNVESVGTFLEIHARDESMTLLHTLNLC